MERNKILFTKNDLQTGMICELRIGYFSYVLRQGDSIKLLAKTELGTFRYSGWLNDDLTSGWDSTFDIVRVYEKPNIKDAYNLFGLICPDKKTLLWERRPLFEEGYRGGIVKCDFY